MDEKIKKVLENVFSKEKTSVLSISQIKIAIKSCLKDLDLIKMIAAENGLLEFIRSSPYVGRPLKFWPRVQWFPRGNKFEAEETERRRSEMVVPLISVIYKFTVNVFDILGVEKIPVQFFEELIEKQFSQDLIKNTIRSARAHFQETNYLYTIEYDERGIEYVSLLGDEIFLKIIFSINSLIRKTWRTTATTKSTFDDYCFGYEEFYKAFCVVFDSIIPDTSIIQDLDYFKTKENLKVFLSQYSSVFRFEDDKIRSICSLQTAPIYSGYPLEPHPILAEWSKWNEYLTTKERFAVENNSFSNNDLCYSPSSNASSSLYNNGHTAAMSEGSFVGTSGEEAKGDNGSEANNFQGNGQISAVSSKCLVMRSPFFAAQLLLRSKSTNDVSVVHRNAQTRAHNKSFCFDDSISNEVETLKPPLEPERPRRVRHSENGEEDLIDFD